MSFYKLVGVLIVLVVTSLAFVLPVAQADCYPPTKLTRAHLGFYKDGVPYCATMFGPTPTWVEVGWEVWDCDGTYRSWGLICNALIRDTNESCLCSGLGGGGPGGGPPEN
jgi:hypothetical protein